MEEIKCKNCGSSDVYTRYVDQVRVCRRCGNSWKKDLKDKDDKKQ